MIDLDHVAAAFARSLPADATLSVFRIDGLDHIGYPVLQASLVRPSGHPVIGYGYGATEKAARVGALGELCEELNVNALLAAATITHASYADLAQTRGAAFVADPLTLCLPAGSDYAPDLTLDWIEARRWPDGSRVLVPREWVAAYPSQLGQTPARLITPITNGLGAGLELEHALAHGVMELLQRDGNVLSYRALDRGVVVDISDDRPGLCALIAMLAAHGIRACVKLACTDLGLANVYVVGEDYGTPVVPIQVSACGEACHPDAEAAVRKALMEFIGSRARKAAMHGPIDLVRAALPRDYADAEFACALHGEEEEPRALEAMAAWLAGDASGLRARLAATVFAERRHVPFSELPSVPPGAADDAKTRLAILVERLAGAGMDILWVDCSPPGGEVRVVKVVVPGLECETMSYHRIGWRGVHRLRERSDPLLLDAPCPGAKRVRLRPEDEVRAGGPAWLDCSAVDAAVGALYPLYREPGPFAAQLLLDRQRAAA